MTALRELVWERRPCALCGSPIAREVATVDRWEVPLTVVRCRECGHVRLDPRPRDEDLPKLYDEGYYTGEDLPDRWAYADERRFPEAAALRARGRLLRIERLAPPGRLLEVGCSFGALLREARARGWSASGVDLSPYACRACAGEGIEVHEGTLEDAPLAPGTVDVLHLAETVEHLPRPRETLRAGARALRPGGLLVVGTANHDSLARLLRGRRWGYYMPGHLQLFSARSLGRLLREEGYRVVSLRFGDDRPLGLLRASRRAAGLPAGLLSTLRDAALRVSLGGFSVGAGMVLIARREGS